MFEGRPYYLDLQGSFSLAVASIVQPYIVFNSFRVNRLSFIVRCTDDLVVPSKGTLSLSSDKQDLAGKAAPICSLSLTLPPFNDRLISPDLEPERYQRLFESAVQHACKWNDET